MATFWKIFSFCLILTYLTSCQSGMRFNKWSEKDCYYSDYYQAPPAFVPDCEKE